jgi:hypothetical protein
MSETYVTLKELAEELGRDRGTLRKWIQTRLQPKVIFLRVRPSGARAGPPSLAVSLEDAARIRQAREDEGFGTDMGLGSGVSQGNGSGWFYVVQPVPEFDQNRLKLGFAVDTKQRLDTYRTICPHAAILKSWPCHPTWERTAIASISREGCRSLGQELFQCDDVQALVDRADAFFKLMPSYTY